MPAFGNNTSLKVNRAITGATTVNANCFARVTYEATNSGLWGGSRSGIIVTNPFTRTFGPSQSIPATISVHNYYHHGGASTIRVATVTYTLVSGYELINTP